MACPYMLMLVMLLSCAVNNHDRHQVQEANKCVFCWRCCLYWLHCSCVCLGRLPQNGEGCFNVVAVLLLLLLLLLLLCSC